MLIDEKKTAEYLGVSVSALRIQRCCGAAENGLPMVPFIKLGRSVRYDTAILEKFIDAHRVGEGAA